MAIESAAALANNLNAMNKKCSRLRPSIDQIRNTLKTYERSRRPRSKEICDTANLTTRLEAESNFLFEMMVSYVVPRGGDLPVDVFCQLVMGATKLDFLPLPEKSFRGKMPFQPGKNGNRSLLGRILHAIPLLGIFFIAHFIISTLTSQVYSFNVENTFSTESGNFITQTILNRLNWICKQASLSPLLSLKYNEKREMVGLFADIVPLQIIWSVESFRRGNALTVATISTLFWIIGQWKGIGYIAPIYYFFHYIQSPLEKYSAPDNRLIPTKYAKTLVAAVTVGYIVPTIFNLAGVSLLTKDFVDAMWYLFPLWTSITHHTFASLIMDTTARDRISNPESDMPYLRVAYAFGAAIGGITHASLWITTFGNLGVVLRNLIYAKEPLEQLVIYHYLITFVSGFIWLFLHLHALKKDGRLETGWVKIIGVLGCTTLVFGPGAGLIAGWAWREEILARHSTNITKS